MSSNIFEPAAVECHICRRFKDDFYVAGGGGGSGEPGVAAAGLSSGGVRGSGTLNPR
jgi:hypothetical protein